MSRKASHGGKSGVEVQALGGNKPRLFGAGLPLLYCSRRVLVTEWAARTWGMKPPSELLLLLRSFFLTTCTTSRHKNRNIKMASTFTVLYFASAHTYTGKSEDAVPGPMTVSKLFPYLEEKYPGFRKKVLGSCALSVNLDYVDLAEDSEREIQNGDEVGIIPPVSSG
ncbi:hypothetical protein TWF225_011626 [Orbilia oligospora]|uniref:Molybdopterin synthase sulfur carrier subunit n=1 Tax=Orbilia oligospora TaxID=2813651 RepID=A0A7C8KA01_ORBOL|nr:hypothetical protein TWF751_007581 [Orbilia oligospora]KAF3192835.1 hypothetical protein TWF225_011626 [Orbilia oligospora]KAF3247209.1 hypothetical protein TWF128_008699 [Orbilia oligospora]KAF3262818.1 hypothetical protein TWF217_004115 [Orbilia oligospora]KAF3284491.1 hypothetical protein TWF132_009775 [Orbilia oligospora]